jgi:predicted dehydrogenase
MTRLRGGLFGCGMISEFHLRGWQRIPEVEIVALGNRTIGRAEERRRAFAPDARIYDDLGSMLQAAELDFVDILTPPALHREHCLLAKEAGVHIICQKPLTDTLESARELVADMEGYPKLFAIHENHRYRPWFQELLRWHREGLFGEVQLVRIEHLNPAVPGESYKLESGQGVLLEYGTHLVDMARALLGQPHRVYARLHHPSSSVRGESLAHVAYEYPGATVFVDAGWKDLGALQGSVLVHGTRGEAFYEGTLTRGESARFRLMEGSTTVIDEVRSPYDDYIESFYLFERACTHAMLTGSEIDQTGEENLKTLEATFAAYDAAARGAIIDLTRPSTPTAETPAAGAPSSIA